MFVKQPRFSNVENLPLLVKYAAAAEEHARANIILPPWTE